MFTIDVGRKIVGIFRHWLTVALIALLMSTQGIAVAQRNDRQQQFLQQQAADRARAAQDAAARAAQAQRDNAAAAANRARSTGSQNSSGTRYPVFNTDRLRTLPSYGGSPANSNTRPGSPNYRPTPGIATPNRPTDRVMFSNGVAKLTRPLTAAEMKRGYTGKQTEDGRALVKFQGRVFAVPASRLGIQPRAANDNSTASSRPSSLSPQRQSAIKAGLGSILGGGGSGGSAGGGGTGAGKPGITGTFNAIALQEGKSSTGSVYSPHLASRILEAQARKSSPENWKTTISSERIAHILFGSDIIGEKRGGGHLYGINNPDKSEFPKGWSEKKIVDTILKIANTSPPIKTQDDGRMVHQVVEEGVSVRVVVEKDGKSIVTAFPVNTSLNPKS